MLTVHPARRIILGGMSFGKPWDHNAITVEQVKEAHDAIDAALEVGVNTIDLADIYTNTKAEQVFGRVLIDRPDLRDRLLIHSKTGIELHVAHNGSNRYNLTCDYIIEKTEEILKRVGVKYLDMLLLHRPDPLAFPTDTARAIDLLYQRGWVKSFGVSNMSAPRLNLINSFTAQTIRANQLQFSLGHSGIIDDIVEVNTERQSVTGNHGLAEYCMLNDISIQAWGSMDKGRFCSPITDSTPESDKPIITKVYTLAEKYSVEPVAIVLAWLMDLPMRVEPVIGTISPNRIKAASKALSFMLSRNDWYDLWIIARGRRLL